MLNYNALHLKLTFLIKKILNSGLTNKITLEASDNKPNIKGIKYYWSRVKYWQEILPISLVWYLTLPKSVLTQILEGIIYFFLACFSLHKQSEGHRTRFIMMMMTFFKLYGIISILIILSHAFGNKLSSFRFQRATIPVVEICFMVLIQLKTYWETEPNKLLLDWSNKKKLNCKLNMVEMTSPKSPLNAYFKRMKALMDFL